DNRPRIGRKPRDLSIVHRHGKNRLSISMQKEIDRYHDARGLCRRPRSRAIIPLPRTFIFPFPATTAIYARMKAIFAMLFLAIACCTFAGCESDMPPDTSHEAPLRRGLSGQGKIVPVDHANDPMINETSGPSN